MWKRTVEWLKSNFPLFILLGVLVATTWKNYSWGTSLLGWDSVQPELDFGLNLKRVLTSVWVGNQGVGHIGGHGYVTILIQGVIEWVMSLVVGVAQTRGMFIFSMLWLGPIGIYFLWKKWFSNTGKFVSWGAMLSGLFYLLNLGTVQVFFAPLEAFTIFYGLLPWAILSIVNYLQQSSRKNLIILLTTQIIFSMIGFIPPQFIAYGVMVLALLVGYMIEKRRDVAGAFNKVLTVGTILLVANLYWLTPVAYYSINGASSYAEAKNNQVSTPDFQYMSEARGKWGDVTLMRGFFIDSSDSVIKGEGKFFEIFEPWNNYLQGRVEGLGYGLFAFSMFGILMMLVKKGRRSLGLSMIFVLGIGWVAIAQAEEPFTTIANLMHQIPVVGQAFRAAFTKFVGLLIFVYAIGFGYGIFAIYKFLREKLIAGTMLIVIGTGSLIFYMWPMFGGNLIYERMKIALPSEYGQVMKFFKNQDKTSRIAYLPSAWMWGWQVHEWGYSGSGFLWYGIEQSILDRAFDVWSPYNETFYNEFSNSLYQCSSNPVFQCSSGVARVLQKYDVRYVLLDESVVASGQDKEILRIEETKKIAEELGWEKKFQEGFLTVWEIGSNPVLRYSGLPVNSFISAPSDFIFVGADTDKVRKDVVFDEVGTYVTTDGKTGEQENENTIFYPFVGLMREEVKGVEYPPSLEATDGRGGDRVTTLRSDLVGFEKGLQPTRSDLGEQNLIVPGWKVGDIVRINFATSSATTLGTQWEPMPAYRMNGQDGPRFLGKEKPDEGKNYIVARVSDGEEWSEYLGERRFDLQGQSLKVEVPGKPQIYDFGKEGKEKIANCDVLGRGVASKSQLTGGNFSPEEMTASSPIAAELSGEKFGSDPGVQGAGYVADGRGAACDYVDMKELDTRLSYLMRIQGENIEGRSLKFFLYNTGSKRNDVEYLLGKGNYDQAFGLLPWSWDGFYSLNIETRSFGQKAENIVGPVEVRWFPLEQIAGAKLITNHKFSNSQIENGLRITEVKKTGTWLYRVKVEGSGLLKLSQGYDEGWIAPPIKHVKVDGWANGWIVNGSGEVTIFYWPQLLEYLGFGFLGMTIIVLARMRK